MSTNNAFCQAVQINQCPTKDHFKFIHTWIQAHFKKKAIAHCNYINDYFKT